MMFTFSPEVNQKYPTPVHKYQVSVEICSESKEEGGIQELEMEESQSIGIGENSEVDRIDQMDTTEIENYDI